MYGSILHQPLDFKNNRIQTRILVGSWLLLGLIISLSYSACLLSFLSLPLQGKPIKTFMDLAKAVKSGTHKCVMLSGVPAVNFLLDSPNKDLAFTRKSSIK
ncbi:lig_chan-Glu_bd domain-containing protein [Caerostris extrusa]|uniref:Lig_chan-Glu_bd domain-containing protein n=1 Tax=Caerostris extrusa TaxID=172846 RepID=A0AAV4UA90_CAEEX|nr:lig_chan-Glu_bd domain-containing protein [Caerostris extrusa]